MSNILKRKSNRYVVQTYTSWTEPQYETHIANSPQELKEISQNSEKVEAVYLLGKEITYAKHKNQTSLTQKATLTIYDGYKNSNERLAALL
jgi:hypothetical protein